MINQEIIKKRKLLGLTQAELANKLGVRQATVADWERGKHKPHPIFIKTLNDITKRKQE